jgi:hypothetical protein
MSGGAMPLSYVNPTYREHSAYSGVNRVISEPGLARPSINHTGGRRSRRKSRKSRKTRKTKGGFYPSVMGAFVQNASRFIPAAGVAGYRMVKNYKKASRKQRK